LGGVAFGGRLAFGAAAGGVCLTAFSMLWRNAAIKSVPATIGGIGRSLESGIPALLSFNMVTTASS
jgi:hypothetical protein